MSQSELVTVMGPEDGSPGDVYVPPSLKCKTDKLEYRRNVRRWYRCVQKGAKNGYPKAKGTASNLGESLVAKMDARFQRIISSATDAGTLAIDGHDDGSDFNEKEQVECIEKILDLVAKESVTDRVNRLIRMSKAVYTCKRRKGETYPEFGDHFGSVARAYLSYANVKPMSHDEQNFAMILIENAKLPTDTYNAIVNRLVTHAKNHPVAMTTAIDTTLLENIKKDIQVLDNLVGQIPAVGTQTQATVTPSLVTSIKQNCKDITSRILGITTPNQTRKKDTFANFSISLDQALEEIQDLKIEEKRKDQEKDNDTDDDTASTKQDTPPPATKQIGTVMTTNSKNDSHNENDNSRKRRDERPRQRAFQRRGSRRNPRFRRQRFSRYRETEDDEYSSDEGKSSRKRRRNNVFDRLGDKKEDAEIATRKKVRFEKQDKATRRKQDESDIDDMSGTDSYFRDRGRRSS